MIHLDTHVVAWLYAGRVDRFSSTALKLLERESTAVSPMAALELQYLYEIQRLTEPGGRVLADLEKRIGLTVAEVSFTEVAAAAHALTWTRDPFDRLIVAQALIQQVPLLTADKGIRKNFEQAVWE
jgi:PIN domain nuclease of toxin-antitoxin system